MTAMPDLSNKDLDEIVQRWHEGGWPEETLQQVVRRLTGWTEGQYGRWVSHGRPDA